MDKNAWDMLVDHLWESWGAELEGNGLTRADLIAVVHGHQGAVRDWARGGLLWVEVCDQLRQELEERSSWSGLRRVLARFGPAHRT